MAAWPASTNASATLVVTTLTLWPQQKLPVVRGHSQPAYMAIRPPPSLQCRVLLYGHTYRLLRAPSLWNATRLKEDRPLSLEGQWIPQIATSGPKWSESKTFDCRDWAESYLWTSPMCRLWLDPALSTCPPLSVGPGQHNLGLGVKIDLSNSHPQVGL